MVQKLKQGTLGDSFQGPSEKNNVLNLVMVVGIEKLMDSNLTFWMRNRRLTKRFSMTNEKSGKFGFGPKQLDI